MKLEYLEILKRHNIEKYEIEEDSNVHTIWVKVWSRHIPELLKEFRAVTSAIWGIKIEFVS